VRMAVEQPGQNGRPGQVDDAGVFGNAQVRADGLDLGALDEDDLIDGRRARRGIDEPTGLDGDGFGPGSGDERQKDQKKRNQRKRQEPIDFFHLHLPPMV